MSINPNIDIPGNAVLKYSLNHPPIGGVRISIADLIGNEKILVYDGPASITLSDEFNINVSSLLPGIYQAIFVADGEVVSVQFIKN